MTLKQISHYLRTVLEFKHDNKVRSIVSGGDEEAVTQNDMIKKADVRVPGSSLSTSSFLISMTPDE